MRALLVIALLGALQTSAQECVRSGDRCRNTRSRGGRHGFISVHFEPQFQFAPVAGTGMGTECTCSAVTSAQGNALTFSRASTAACLSANGQSITVCPVDAPRVMTGAVDDSQLGLYVENTARTNVIDDARDLSVASWSKTNMTCAHTATGMLDGGDANGASTCTATSNGGKVVATTGEAGGAYQCFSLYLKRRTGTGTVQLTMDDSTYLADIAGQLSTTVWKRAVPGQTVGCLAAKGGTSRCIVQAGLMTAPATVKVGLKLGTSGDAVDIDFVQDERCPDFRASSPVVTSGGNGTRAAEAADVAMSLSFPVQFCAAGTVIQTAYSNEGEVGWAPTADMRWIGVPGDRNPGVTTGSASYVDALYDRTETEWEASTTTLVAPLSVETSLVWDAGVRTRGATYWNMTRLNACIDGRCGVGVSNRAEADHDDAGVVYTAPSWVRYRLGGYDSTTGVVNGVMKHIEADPRAVVCQRYLDVAPRIYAASLGDSISCCPSVTVPGWPGAANATWALTGSRIQVAELSKGSAFAGYEGAAATANNLLRQWTDFARGRGYSIVFTLGGVNDIKSGTDMDLAYAALQRIWDEARSDGLRVFPMTLTPASENAGWDGTKQTKLETLNARIRAYCASRGLTCIELYTPTYDEGGLRAVDGGTAMDSRVDSGDGLHPNALGETRIATKATTAVP